MRYAIAFFLLCVAVAFLTACGDSLDDVKRDSEIVKACKDGGGHIGYDGFNNIYCSFRAP